MEELALNETDEPCEVPALAPDEAVPGGMN
jgi:hypothetical protein